MTIKQERAARLIQEIISELLMGEVTDPALQDVTVTEVKVDREIEYAEIYIHSLDDHDTVMAGLDRANGFLRHELAVRTRFRKAPILRFRWDDAIDHGERIDELLRELHEQAQADPEPTPEIKEDQESDDDAVG
jgi:ribosome-binding factor A